MLSLTLKRSLDLFTPVIKTSSSGLSVYPPTPSPAHLFPFPPGVSSIIVQFPLETAPPACAKVATMQTFFPDTPTDLQPDILQAVLDDIYI